jgi:hypothetical protein
VEDNGAEKELNKIKKSYKEAHDAIGHIGEKSTRAIVGTSRNGNYTVMLENVNRVRLRRLNRRLYLKYRLQNR